MNRTAVVDCASLIYLAHLHQRIPFFNLLRNIFSTLHFPSAVIGEFAMGAVKEPHRQWLLNRLGTENQFYRFCSSYDSIVLATVEHAYGIDKGEAEAYAQLRKVNARFIISDDKRFTEALRQLDQYVTVYNTLHIICWLKILQLLPVWKDVLQHLHAIRPFKSKDVRRAYMDVAHYLGTPVVKKDVSALCSLKGIL